MSVFIQSFTIEAELPTLNEYIAAERGNRFAASRMKCDWTKIVRGSAYGLRPVRNYPVQICCTWWMKDRRKDLDNVRFGVKFVLDGLQAAGVLRGDGQQYVVEFEDIFRMSKARPRVEVAIVEAEK